MTSTYVHWGSLDGNPEPSDTNTLCANSVEAMNFSEPGGNAGIKPWGWASRGCEERTQYMCRMQSELTNATPADVLRWCIGPVREQRCIGLCYRMVPVHTSSAT